jgi:hypothetical protein
MIKIMTENQLTTTSSSSALGINSPSVTLETAALFLDI